MDDLHHDILGGWLFVESDPGIPAGKIADPFAGLEESAVEGLRQQLDEGKAIGTALLKANVGTRDASLRPRSLADATIMRGKIRRAATNIARQLRPIIREDRRGIPRGQARQVMRRMVRRWLRGRLTYSEMQVQSSARLREFHERVRDLGRQAAGLTQLGVSREVLREEEEWFRGAVREELVYWHTFLRQIEEGEVPEHEIWMRVDRYVKALRFMFEAARAQALPDNVLVYWMGPKKDDPTICDGCIAMMEWSPFPKELLPAVPRDGSTPCLTNCRHRLMVRVAKQFNDVVRRKGQLDRMRIETRRRPTKGFGVRGKMMQALLEIKGRRANLHRAGGRASNPFRGERLPAVPPYVPLRRRHGRPLPYMPESAGETETCGIFLRVPADLAKGWPSLGEEDKSPPHCTMLYVGEVDPARYWQVVDACREAVQDLEPFAVEMTDYGEFQNMKGQTIAHMVPRVLYGLTLAEIHEMLYAAVTQRGIPVEHIRKGAFKPHCTLAYVDEGKAQYSGPRPQGTWRVDSLEVWGSGVWSEGRLGNTRVPFGGAPPVEIREGWRTQIPAYVTEQSATPYRSFDSVPYSTMDLRDLARLLLRAARARDRDTLIPLVDRLLGALEHTIMAIEGRPRGMQVAQALRGAFLELTRALDNLPEATVRKVGRVQSLLERLEDVGSLHSSASRGAGPHR